MMLQLGKGTLQIVNNEISALINNLVSRQKIIRTVTGQLHNLLHHLCMFCKKSKFVPYYLILEYDRIILKKFLIITFFMTKNEVPHEFYPLTNDIFTCKTTPYLQALKIHCCYGYMIIPCLSQQKKHIKVKWFDISFVFI